MNDLVVRNEEGVPVTDSVKVAWKFEKRHDHVLGAIRKMLQSVDNLAPEKSGACKSMFYEMTYIDGNGDEQPMYIMSEEGFSLLVMGFTGEKALDFKLDFMLAFKSLKEHATGLFQENQELKKEVLELQGQQKLLSESQKNLVELKKENRELYEKLSLKKAVDSVAWEFYNLSSYFLDKMKHQVYCNEIYEKRMKKLDPWGEEYWDDVDEEMLTHAVTWDNVNEVKKELKRLEKRCSDLKLIAM